MDARRSMNGFSNAPQRHRDQLHNLSGVGRGVTSSFKGRGGSNGPVSWRLWGERRSSGDWHLEAPPSLGCKNPSSCSRRKDIAPTDTSVEWPEDRSEHQKNTVSTEA